jgi:hypothetical protein
MDHQTGLGLNISSRPCFIQRESISINGSIDSFNRKDEYAFLHFQILLPLLCFAELLDSGTIVHNQMIEY